MSEVERIFDREALLKGRAAALSDIKQAMRNSAWRESILFTFTTIDRAKVDQDVFERVREEAKRRGFSDHKIRSFIAGYSDTMTAFAAGNKIT